MTVTHDAPDVVARSGSPRRPGPTGIGFLAAIVSAATFATAGPFAKSLLEAGWTPGSVVLLRITGASLLLLWPALRAVRGRWPALAAQWRHLLAYGAMAVAVPQLAFFYAVAHLPVGVALMLEYLALVLVVLWQSVVARRLPGRRVVAGVVLALIGLVLVLDVMSLIGADGAGVDGIGVVYGLVAATGLASYFLLGERGGEASLPPLVLAAGGLVVAAVLFAVLGATGLLPMTFSSEPVLIAGARLPAWVAVLELAAVAAATAYVTGIAAARMLGATLASFVGLTEVLFAVLFAWVLLGELPRPVQLLGGVFILAGVVVVRLEGRQRLKRSTRARRSRSA